ncbi:cadherin-like domain-containing protein [Lyngbya aestuarii]|uniref:cadherin-like domain-containing protein n=1 Tax=Lyngbya aestuarii TaxID=118322 RepID=UPI00403DE435
MPTFTWTGAAADNSWSNPANWVDELNNNAVPGELDIAIVDVDVNVTTDVDINVTQLNLLAGTLNCIGNTNWSGNFDVAENAGIQLNGESYTFGAGVNFTGLGLLEVVSGELEIADEVSIKSKFKSNANGKVKVKNKLKLEGDSEINGQCELDENASLELIGENHILAAGSDFIGNGTLDVISGNVNVDSDISIKSKFKSSTNSQLNVKSKLKLEGDSEISSQCDLADNASLELIGLNHTLAAGSDFTGNGTLDVISGNVNVDSDISIKSKFKSSTNSQLNVKSKLKLEGDSEISSQCDLADNASLELIGLNHTLAAGSDFTGNGTLDVISGNVNVDSDISIKSKFKSSTNSQLNVKSKLKLEGDSEISSQCDLADNASLELIGLNHTLAAGSDFTGNGTLDVISGNVNVDSDISIKSKFKSSTNSQLNVKSKLKLEGDSEITGSFDLAEGATVEFSGGTHNLDSGTAFTGTGLVKVTGGIFNVNETINVEKFELTGGTVVGQDKIIANIFVENFGLTLGEGKDKAISNEFLEVTDVNATPDQIVYTLTTLPAEGTLLLNGAALGVNGTFSQSDINNGLVTYQDGDSDAPGDSFGFTATANGQEITSSSFAFTIGSVAEFRDTGTAGIFAFTETSTSATLQFSVDTSSIPSLHNEIGVFNVDDDQGTIDGIAPGEDGYLQAAFNRAKVINSVLANNPNGFQAVARLLGFESTDRLGFYLVQDGTTDTVLAELAGGGTPDNVSFSTSGSLEVANFSSTGFTLQWSENVAINVESVVEDSTPGTGVQGETQGELLDLRDFTGQVSASYTVHREADFDNVAGFYVVQNEQGAILDELTGQLVNPGDEGYGQIAIRQRLDLELSVENQGTVNISSQLDAGVLLAPFLMVDGSLDDFQSSGFSLSQSSSEVYFAFLGANSDGADHITLLGDNQWGFEDLPSAVSDKDYNDLTITLNLAVA